MSLGWKGLRETRAQWAMPIPPSPERPDTPSTILRLFSQVHDLVREELKNLDDTGLNWIPTAGANSIATIIIHLVGSEAETLKSVAGVHCERNRDAEFTGPRRSIREVLAELEQADALLTELGPRIDEEVLEGEFPLPTLPDSERRSGLTWLVGNYGHAREHVGQIQLTKQLYLDDTTTAWAEGLDETEDPRE